MSYDYTIDQDGTINPPLPYKPQAGDEVEVVLRGKVWSPGLESFNLGVFDKGYNHIAPHQDHVVSVKKVEPPVECFGAGDLVRNKLIPHFTYYLGNDGYTTQLGNYFTFRDGDREGLNSKYYELVYRKP